MADLKKLNKAVAAVKKNKKTVTKRAEVTPDLVREIADSAAEKVGREIGEQVKKIKITVPVRKPSSYRATIEYGSAGKMLGATIEPIDPK